MPRTVGAGPAGQEVRACADASIHEPTRTAGCWTRCHGRGATVLAWHLTPCRSVRSTCLLRSGLPNAGFAALGTSA
jgi:hypothetical protein